MGCGRRSWGALFAAARGGRLRLSWAVVGWYGLVALLHGLWDASQVIAVRLTLVVTGSPVQWLEVQLGQAPAVTSAQLQLFTILSWGCWPWTRSWVSWSCAAAGTGRPPRTARPRPRRRRRSPGHHRSRTAMSRRAVRVGTRRRTDSDPGRFHRPSEVTDPTRAMAARAVFVP